MDEKRDETKGDEGSHGEDFCPVCSLRELMRCRRKKYGQFFDHLYSAQIELLRAFRSLADEQIASLEKRKSSKEQKKKVTRIEVE